MNGRGEGLATERDKLVSRCSDPPESGRLGDLGTGLSRLAPGEAVVVADGGGTKTDIAVLDLDGALLARSRLGAFTPSAPGDLVDADGLDAAIRSVLDAAGRPTVAAAGVYLSCLDFPHEVDAFRAAVAGRDWAGRHLLVDNDTFALLRAGTDEPTAVAVVCGTGMNCVGRAPGRRAVRFAAIGDVSGDWGGGSALGLAAIWHAARAADGRGPATALEPLVLRAFGRASMDEVIVGFATGELADTGPLAPLVFEAADAGDEVAAGLVARQADEIVAFASAALARLGALGTPCPVVLGGGVVAAGHEGLLRAVDAGLAARAPGARAVVVREPPVLGAALLAFEALGADPGVLARVRAALRKEQRSPRRSPPRSRGD